MPTGEHVHIISAGENIHTAYPAIFRTLPVITHTYVLADSETYTLSSNPEIEKQRLAIRHAVDAVKEISESLSIPFSRQLVFPPVYESVRDILTKIARENPGARFTFDLSGGSKELCMATLSFASWLNADVCATFGGKIARNVPLPDRPIRTMLANLNYQTILAILLRKNPKDPDDGTRNWIQREYIYKQLWSVYVPSRTKKVKPGDPVAQPVTYKRGRKPAAEMTHGTLSTLMHSLEDAALVEERVSPDTRREKSYRITERGEIAFRLFSDPSTSSLVRMILEKNGRP
ncbi:MAG: hypothetical protein ABSG49_10565 [Methanoregula sp.]|jgi:hypothetical protein|uniref:hypothetical protein n=1 Tax=Methanoregula sp. TaxID=2052170 RepID=UPI003C14670C